MKGGITSGIVYPPAIIQLSRKYRFKNIGGTSAGAIAAAAAAAEYGRKSGGFEKLAGMSPDSQNLSPGSVPAEHRPFRPIYRAFLAVLGAKGTPSGKPQPWAGLWSEVTGATVCWVPFPGFCWEPWLCFFTGPGRPGFWRGWS